jgi:hypothetical protein
MISLNTVIRCQACGVEKYIVEFYAQKGGALGVRKTCKQCCKEYQRLQYGADKERIKARRRNRYRIQSKNIYIEKPYPAHVQQEVSARKITHIEDVQQKVL